MKSPSNLNLKSLMDKCVKFFKNIVLDICVSSFENSLFISWSYLLTGHFRVLLFFLMFNFCPSSDIDPIWSVTVMDFLPLCWPSVWWVDSFLCRIHKTVICLVSQFTRVFSMLLETYPECVPFYLYLRVLSDAYV